MAGIPAGRIVLRDEGTKTSWKVEDDPGIYGPYRVFRCGSRCDHPPGRRASCRL